MSHKVVKYNPDKLHTINRQLLPNTFSLYSLYTLYYFMLLVLRYKKIIYIGMGETEDPVKSPRSVWSADTYIH